MIRQDRGAIEVTEGAPRVKTLEVGRLRVSRASFPAGHRIASHYHERACLSVILEGFFLQSFPGSDCECPRGGLIVKPPGERHMDRWGEARTRHLIIEPLSVDDDLGAMRTAFERVTYRLDPGAAHLGGRIARELERDDDLVPLAVESLAGELVVRAGRIERRSAPDSAPPPWLRRIRELIEDRYSTTLRLQDLAAEADVHPSRLSREFRRHYGRAPSAYLRAVRLERARADLEATSRDLASVAIRNGFSDQSHLTRMLKRATGVTPAVYRRESSRLR